jgi:DNA repair protein RadC
MRKQQVKRETVIRELATTFATDVELVAKVTGVEPSKITKPLSYLVEATDAELAQWFTTPQIQRLRAAFELSKRATFALPEVIRAPSDAAAFLKATYQDKSQEYFVVLCLNTKNRIISVVELYKGSLNSSLLRVGEVFSEAIRVNACAIIIAHNHPSGDPTPSADDIQVTRDIAAAGKLLDIDVLDHLVIGSDGWISLRERGLGFGNI